MRILSMTATFGKLEHATLTLEPGLNILQAPNEWGKSTWCAFLAAMLYGLDTRAKNTKTTLADKERYAPWSGSPMSGRMTLEYAGREITIERHTRGRVPMGEFRAYETHTGIPVRELTAANCGETLLGVEKSVFLRTALIRLADLPVTQDESLRRRLNALVTTGDESADADDLDRRLRELKNRCRHNRTGLLPQAEGELEQLLHRQEELDGLQEQARQRMAELEEVNAFLQDLKNHRDNLRYQEALRHAQQVEQAEAALEQALRERAACKAACDWIPEEADPEAMVQQLTPLRQQARELRRRLEALPEDVEEAEDYPSPEQATEDARLHAALDREAKAAPWFPALSGGVLLLAGIVLLMQQLLWGLLPTALGGAVLALGLRKLLLWSRRAGEARQQRGMLEAQYGCADPRQWPRLAREHADARSNAGKRAALSRRLEALHRQMADCCQPLTPEEADRALRELNRLAAAEAALEQARQHHDALREMARQAPPPRYEDALTFTPAQTRRLYEQAAAQQQLLRQELGQCAGRREALDAQGDPGPRIAALRSRIARLEAHYEALDTAAAALQAARTELQRRFAPRIAQRAGELLSRLTLGRYDRLTLDTELSIRTGTVREDTLRSVLWRSDGTVDQLYLALRLAVAGELTPQAPLILDDALVRFDDDRLRTALEVLSEEARQRQVLLFTCQSREAQLTGKGTVLAE